MTHASTKYKADVSQTSKHRLFNDAWLVWCVRKYLMAVVLGLSALFQIQAAKAEVFYGVTGTGIYSVDTINGGPATLLVTFAAPLLSGATLAVRPSDGVLFYLDSQGTNPNLWRWDPNNPSIAPVLIGTPGATTTGVIRLGFDAANVLYAMNPSPATLWTLDSNTGAILTATPASGATIPGGGDICLQPGTGALYMVAGTSLYTLTPAGVVTLLGTPSGITVNMAGCAFDRLGRLVVTQNATLYSVNIGALSATALSGSTGVAFGDLATAPGRVADLRLSKSASNITPGNTVSFTVTVTNDGPARATDVRAVDLLPAGLTFVSSTVSQGSYTSGTGIWLVGGLNNGAAATLTINASVTGTTPITNTAQITYSDQPDPDSTPNNSLASEDDQASVTITPSPDLQLTKSTTSTFAVGVNSTYSISVNNTLGSAATSGNYTVTDNMPPGLTIVGTPSGTGWNCAASTTVQLSCFSSTVMNPGTTNPNPITFTILPSISASPSVTNIASISGGGEPVSNAGNNTSTLLTAVCSSNCTDLRVGKTGPANFTVGTNGTYTLSANNILGGLATVGSYTITDPLPTGLTIATVPVGTGWTCLANTPLAGDNIVGGSRVVCTSSTVIAAGASNPNNITFTVAVANTAVPSVSNTATISGGGEPPAATGNNATTLVTPVSDFNLTLTKVGPASFALGVNAAYTITVNNTGSAVSTGTYTVADNLPTGLTFVSAVGTGWTCTANTPVAGDNVIGGTRMVCTNATAIAAAASAPAITLTVAVAAAAAPSVTNTASVSNPNEASTNTSNNTSTAITPVLAPNLFVTKTHTGNFTVGTNGVYTITVSNIGGQATNAIVTVTDTLPTGLTFVSATGTNWTCSAAGQIVTCTLPAANPIAANTSGPPISLTVSVAAAAAPSVTNPVAVSGGGEPAGNNGNNTDNDLTAVFFSPQITKAFTTNPILAGNPTKLTLTISNPAANSVSLNGVAVVDPFPAGMTVANTPNFSNSCGGTVSLGQLQGDSVISLTGGGPIAAGASCTIQVDVTSSTIGANVNTTGSVSSSNSGVGNTATATLTVNSPGSPTLTKVSSPDPIGVNRNATLTFTILNKATTTNGINFQDVFPTYIYQGTVSNGCGGTLVNQAGAALVAGTSTGIRSGAFNLAASASCTIVINVASAIPGTYTNTGTGGTPNVTVIAGGLDVSGVNDTLNVRGTTLTKDFTPASIPINANSTLTFTITNGVGNPQQNNLTFIETLPTNVTVVGTPVASQCGGTVSSTATTISLTGGFIGSGQTNCTIVATVTSATVGVYNNVAANVTGTSAGMTNSVNATLTVAAPPVLSKVSSPNPVGVGLPATLTFTVTNSAGNPAQTGLGFIDTLPAGLTIANATTSNTCNGTLTDSSNNALAANATSVKLVGGSMTASVATCTITVNVSSTTPAAYANTAAGNITGLSGGLSATGLSDTLNVRGTTLTKAFSPTAIPLGGTSTLSFTVANGTGNPAQANLSFIDTLPGGMTLATVPATSQCGGTVSGVIGGNTITFSGGSLALATANCLISTTVSVASAATYTNNAGNMSGLSPGMTNSVNATLTIVAQPALTKAFSPTLIGSGENATLTFTITNPATAPITNDVGFTDTLPAGLVVANPVTFGGSCASNTGTALSRTAVPGAGNIAVAGVDLAAGLASCTVTILVTNATGITGTCPQANLTNATTNISALQGGLLNQVVDQCLSVAANPIITKSFTTSPLNENAASTLVFTVTNAAGNPAQTGIAFIDTLPTGLQLTSGATAVLSGAGCSGTATVTQPNIVNFSAGAMTLGTATCAITVTSITNVGGQTNATCASNPVAFTNDAARISGLAGAIYSGTPCLVVIPLPRLTKALLSNPFTVGINQNTTLTFSIDNTAVGAAAQTSLAFTDTFPANMIVGSPNGVSFANCGAPTVAAVAGSGLVTVTGVDVAAAATCTISINVSGNAPGSYANSAAQITSTTGNIINAVTTQTLNVRQVALTKNYVAASILTASTSTLTFTITNGVGNPAQGGINFTDTLTAGAGLTINSVTALSGAGCSAITPTFNATSPASVTLNGASMAAATATCTFTVNVTGNTAAAYANTAANISAASAVVDTSGVNSTLTVFNRATLTKAFSATNIAAGSATTLTFTLSNGASNPAQTGLGFTDTLPGTGALTATTTASQCNGGTVAVSGVNNNIITVTNAQLASGASCTITATVTGVTAGSYINGPTNTSISAVSSNLNNQITDQILSVYTPPTITKTFGAASIAAGGTTTLTLTLNNPAANPGALTSVQVDDTFPAGLTLANTTFTFTPLACGIVTKIAGGASVTGDNNIRFNAATIAAGSSCQVVAIVTSSTSGAITNTTTAVTATGPVALTGLTASAPLSVFTAPTIVKAFVTPTIALGGTSQINFTITNANAAALTGVAFGDTLANMFVNAAGAATGTCAGAGSNTFTAGQTGLLNFTGLGVPASGSCTVSIIVKSNTPGAQPNTTTGVSSNEAPTSVASNTAILTVTSGAPSVAKVFAPASIASGGVSTLTITVTNPNAAPITVTSVTDTFPTSPGTGVVRASTPNTATTCAGGAVTSTAGSVTLTGGTVPANGTCTYQIDVTAQSAGAYNNVIAIGALTTNVGANTVAATATLTVTPVANVSTTKSGPATVLWGTTISYTAIVSNAGPDAADLTVFTDAVPAAITGVTATCVPSGSAACGSVNVTGNNVSSTITSLPAGGSVTFTIQGTAPQSGTLLNTATAIVPSGITDPDDTGRTGAGNNTSLPVSTIVQAPDLTITKTSAATTLTVGSNASFTLTPSNTLGTAPTSGVVTVVDALPTGLTFVALGSGGTGWSCNAVGQVVTCTSSAVIGAGATGAPITINVVVGSTAVPSINNLATIAGGNEPSANSGNNNANVIVPVLTTAVTTFTTDGAQTSTPGSAVFYPHTFTAGTAGSVTFATISTPSPNIAGWGVTLYRDTNCNGVLDGVEGSNPLTGSVPVVAGEQVCIVIKSAIPNTAPLNAQDSILVTATFTPTVGPVVVLSHQDITTVGAVGAGLVLTKAVRNITQGGALGVNNTAKPGDVLEYVITYTNASNSPLNTVVISDNTPAFTVFQVASCGALPAIITACSPTTQPAVGAAGNVQWTLTGSLNAMQSGTVVFRVVVQ